MRRKLSRDPKDTPLSVILGEWWEDRRAEIGAMSRAALERELGERGVLPETGLPMTWLRYRLAYLNQIEFFAERGKPVPERVLRTADRLASANPERMGPEFVNIFRAEGA
mgnify:CR=1 FL=1